MNLKSIAFAIASCTCLANAHADFSGAYDPTQWTVSNTNGGNGSALATAGALQLSSSNFTVFDDAPLDPSTLTFSIVVAQASTISFNWAYATHDDNGSTNDTFAYAVSGVAVQLSANGSYASQSGTKSIFVNAGNSFSFQTTSTDNIFGSAVTNVTGFNAIASVPEPGGCALALAALPVLGVALRRRRKEVRA